jgi:N-methylhydantoinase B
MPPFLDTVLHTGERLASQACGGGGYGDPLARDPRRVVQRLTDGWISERRALDVYGVVVDADRRVDEAATAARRDRLRADRAA